MDFEARKSSPTEAPLPDVFAAEQENVNRLTAVFERLERDRESLKFGFRPKQALLGDSYHIENQQIDFVDARDIGHLLVSFKLTKESYEVARARMEQGEGTKEVAESNIIYQGIGDYQKKDFLVSDAWEVMSHGLKIKVSKGTISGHMLQALSVGAAEGLVTIEIPAQPGMNIDSVALRENLAKAMSEVFGISDAMEPPSAQAEDDYRLARYRWHHRLPSDLSRKDSERAGRLVREEVYPGHFTMVDHGKHQEYKRRFGSYALYHALQWADGLPAILHMGLMSGHERIRRGRLTEGYSTQGDFQSGAADSALVRLVTEKNFGREQVDARNIPYSEYVLIFNPAILDRTDWYAYDWDRVGSSQPEEMRRRLPPEDLFEDLGRNSFRAKEKNEEMFRAGIAKEDILAVACVFSERNYALVADEVLTLGRELGIALDQDTLKAALNKDPDSVRALFGNNILAIRERLESALAKENRMRLLLALEKESIAQINGRSLSESVVYIERVNDLLSITENMNPSEQDTSLQEKMPTAESNIIDESMLRRTNAPSGANRGTNEGHWYEDRSSGEKYYVKFYENPDQARIEFLTNAIYKKLGIKATSSQLIEIEGKLAIASREIPMAQAISWAEQHQSKDVLEGFVADAYLANWDVIGLHYDNILKSENGDFVRSDGGGSLTFRAQGEPKEFSADFIPELETMRNPQYPAGTIFKELSEEEMRHQAEKLVDRLKPADIEELMRASGLEGVLYQTIRNGLLGRRNVLIEHFKLGEKG